MTEDDLSEGGGGGRRGVGTGPTHVVPIMGLGIED